jgi:hypothetical protein
MSRGGFYAAKFRDDAVDFTRLDRGTGTAPLSQAQIRPGRGHYTQWRRLTGRCCIELRFHETSYCNPRANPKIIF